MPREKRLAPAAQWIELTTTEADWNAADPALLTTHARAAAPDPRVRGDRARPGRRGPDPRPGALQHRPGGRRGRLGRSRCAQRDTVNGSHRGHHQFLAKALAHVAPKGIARPGRPVTPEVASVLLRSLAEICGLARGFSHGRGGSMHLQWKEAGAIGTNAIVGGGVPLAAGSAWAHKHAGTDAVAVTYFGDGAVNIGSTLESLNLAAAWKLPLCFFIENNRYAVSTTVDEATGEPRLSARGLGLRHRRAGRSTAWTRWPCIWPCSEAVAHLRAGNGPDGRRGATSTASSTRTARSPAALSATAPRRRSALARARPARPRSPASCAAALPDRRGRRRVGARAGAQADGRRRPCCSSRCPAGKPGAAAHQGPSGRTRPSSTWASAVT